jgi:pyruvate dehydrogenase E2 component (dihydrolipoamide acetyltransferase)
MRSMASGHRPVAIGEAQEMTIEIRMPAFSATMESAKLISWLVEEGASVEKGQVIAEVETDKAVAEIESPVSGTVKRIMVQAGDDDVKVEVPLIELSTDDSDSEPESAPRAGAASAAALSDGTAPETPRFGRRVAAAPAARRAAKDAGIDIEEVAGTGPGGRITRQDVLNYSRSATPGPDDPALKLPSLRFSIARAMVRSKTTVPHFYTETDIFIDRLIALKKETSNKNPDVRVTITAFLILAVSRALADVREANYRWENNSIVRKEACDIAVAVDVGDGVVAPVIRNADKMDALRVATRLGRLVADARSGSLKQTDLGDASLTISNLGMFSIDRFYPIVNVPEPLIVGIGRARREAVVVDDEIVIRSVITMTLSADHRVIDGAVAGRFAGSLKHHIENEAPATSAGSEK